MPSSAESRLRDIWTRVAPKCAEFDLVLPGNPSFVCQASSCPVHCCKVFGIVPLGDREVIRLSRASGIAPLTLIETEDGEPLTHPAFPAGRPYFLARSNGICRFLGPDLLCGQYAGRPDACRQYPHYLFFFDSLTERPVKANWSAMRAAVGRLAASGPTVEGPELVPLLLRHRDCPGFTGPPLSPSDWRTLLDETLVLQYGDTSEPASPAAAAPAEVLGKVGR
jgi:Fe-S-cluster containining protein